MTQAFTHKDVEHLVRKWSPWMEDKNWYEHDSVLGDIIKSKREGFFSPPKMYYLLRRNFRPIVDDPDENWGIVLLRGPRRVGKTALMKYLILEMIEEKWVKRDNVVYLSFDSEELLPVEPHMRIRSRNMMEVIEKSIDLFRDRKSPFFLFLDEVTFYRPWARVIKNLVDRGIFGKGMGIVVSGSYSMELASARAELFGRLGNLGKEVVMYPRRFIEVVENVLGEKFRRMFSRTLGNIGKRMGFVEYLAGLQKEINRDIYGYIKDSQSLMDEFGDDLWAAFESYKMTGGYPRAISEYALSRDTTISDSRYIHDVYELLVHDAVKFGLDKEKLRRVLLNFDLPVFMVNMERNYSKLFENVEIKREEARKYLRYLTTSGLFMFLRGIGSPSEISEDRKMAVPGSRKLKAVVADPLAFFALYWGSRGVVSGLFTRSKKLADEFGDHLAESIVLSHLRHFPGMGEGNLSFIDNDNEELCDAYAWFVNTSGEFVNLFLEVKNTERPKMRELKGKFEKLREFGAKKMVVLCRGNEIREDEHVIMLPIVLFLLLF